MFAKYVLSGCIQVGFVVRANLSLGIAEDMWCLCYPEDTEYSPPSVLPALVEQQSSAVIASQNQQILHDFKASFAALLGTLLPQIQTLVALTAQQANVTVSYYAHPIDSSQAPVGSLGPPAAPQNILYRTLGTLDSPFHSVTGKFAENCYFHDIILR